MVFWVLKSVENTGSRDGTPNEFDLAEELFDDEAFEVPEVAVGSTEFRDFRRKTPFFRPDPDFFPEVLNEVTEGASLTKAS